MKVDQYSDEHKKELTKGVMNYLDSWKLSSDQVMNVLNLPDTVRSRSLAHFRGGMKAFPEEVGVWERVDHLIGIADALRTTYPFSEPMRLVWLRKPHRRFNRRCPLDVMLEEGVAGLLKVRIDVDCAYGWKISETMAAQSK